MAPTSTADLPTPEEDLQDAAGPRLIRSSDSRSECKVSESKGSNRPSNDWKLRLRSRSSRPGNDPARRLRLDLTAKNVQASSPSAKTPSAKKSLARKPLVKKPSIKQPLVKEPPVKKPPARKRKAPDGDSPHTTKKTKKTKTKALRNPENTRGQTGEQELWEVKPSARVNPTSNNGTLSHIPYTPLQGSTYKDDKRTKRKRKASILEDPQDSRASIPKRQKTIEPIQSLTRKNLELLENSMAPLLRSKSVTTVSKRSDYTTPSSVSSAASSRSLAANNIRFELELRALNVDYTELEKPDPEEVARVLEVMEKKRDSPEPDSKLFHEIRRIVKSENEASITKKLTPLLLVERNLSFNSHKTSNLLYRSDTSWGQWGSARPGRLPVPKPDLCISYKGSAFNPDKRERMVSPYVDTAGFAPFLICEVKTALQGDEIADRQNANNVIHVLKADFNLQKKLGRDRTMERKIRVITTAHNTRNQWYHAWFYVLGDDGNPKWCFYLVKHITIDRPEENGFQTARGCFLNLCEYFDSEILPKLRADLAEASKLPLTSTNGAPFQPGLAPDLGPDIQPDAPLSTGSQTPEVPPSDEGDDSVTDVQPGPKRAKAATRSAARSKAQTKRGKPKIAESKPPSSNRVKRRGRDAT